VAGRSIHTSVRDPGGRLDATVDVHPGTGRHGGEVDQVRNGNRWRVTAVDQTTNRLAAERLTDRARVVFDDEYLREHVRLGYAVIMQGVTTDTAHAVIAVIADTVTRAMAYVALNRFDPLCHIRPRVFPGVD
jgi:hypothetical protein